MAGVRHGSLFSGIGGFDLAAGWMGWQNVFQVEISAFCRKILACHFPETKRYQDIKAFKGAQYYGTIDIISGGFPCQPFSTAGKRRGRADDRFLWPHALRVIDEIRPRWVVLENVGGIISLLEQEPVSEMEIKEAELFCKDKIHKPDRTFIRIQRRLIGSIISEIGSIGYLLPTLTDGTPIILCIPACAVGAPHRRDRIWIIAYNTKEGRSWNVNHAGAQPCFNADPGGQASSNSDRDRWDGGNSPDEKQFSERGKHALNDIEQDCSNASNAHGIGFERIRQQAGAAPKGWQSENGHPSQFTGNYWDSWPTVPAVCDRNDGLPNNLDGVTLSKWRQQTIHSFGNAIVPQVAFEIFQAIGAVL